MMNCIEFLASLGINPPADVEEPAFFTLAKSVYDEACREYDREGCVCTSDSFLETLYNEFDQKWSNWDSVLRAAAIIRGMPELARFTVLLASMLKADPKAVGKDSSWNLPVPPEGADPFPYEMTGFLALLPSVPAVAAQLRERKVPEDIVNKSLVGLSSGITVFAGNVHAPGYNAGRVRWSTHHLVPDLLSIGRLGFEMRAFPGHVRAFTREDGTMCVLADGCRLHRSGLLLGAADCEDEEGAFDADYRETDAFFEGCPVENGRAKPARIQLPRSEWKEFLAPGDPVISVHIPGFAPFGHDIVVESYQRARAVFGLSFPDFPYRAFVCGSWLMDPMLDTLLEGKGNIVRFQRDFYRYPNASKGKAVYTFLYGMPNAAPADLPADSTLRRKVRDLLISGGHIYELGGILMPQALQ